METGGRRQGRQRLAGEGMAAREGQWRVRRGGVTGVGAPCLLASLKAGLACPPSAEPLGECVQRAGGRRGCSFGNPQGREGQSQAQLWDLGPWP